MGRTAPQCPGAHLARPGQNRSPEVAGRANQVRRPSDASSTAAETEAAEARAERRPEAMRKCPGLPRIDTGIQARCFNQTGAGTFRMGIVLPHHSSSRRLRVKHACPTALHSVPPWNGAPHTNKSTDEASHNARWAANEDTRIKRHLRPPGVTVQPSYSKPRAASGERNVACQS